MNIAARANIRPAAANDFPALSELAFRSKSHWGYDAAFMAACRNDLTITAVDAADELVYVLERSGALIGFYALRPLGDTAELTNLFVEPKPLDMVMANSCGHTRSQPHIHIKSNAFLSKAILTPRLFIGQWALFGLVT
jgi:hypothetical protein